MIFRLVVGCMFIFLSQVASTSEAPECTPIEEGRDVLRAANEHSRASGSALQSLEQLVPLYLDKVPVLDRLSYDAATREIAFGFEANGELGCWCTATVGDSEFRCLCY